MIIVTLIIICSSFKRGFNPKRLESKQAKGSSSRKPGLTAHIKTAAAAANETQNNSSSTLKSQKTARLTDVGCSLIRASLADLLSAEQQQPDRRLVCH